MVNQHTGFKVAVTASPAGFPFVAVPAAQLDLVQRLLIENGIGHTLPEQYGEDEQLVIQIGKLFDRQHVQDVLDRVH